MIGILKVYYIINLNWKITNLYNKKMLPLVVLIIFVGLFYSIWDHFVQSIRTEKEYIHPMDSSRVNYRRGGGEFARMSKRTNIPPVTSRKSSITNRSKSV